MGASAIESKRDNTKITRLNLLSHLIEGQRVLEIGCGNGDLSSEVAKKGFDVVCVDMSTAGIRQAAEHANNDGITNKLNFLVTDGARLAFQDDSFDSVIIAEVLEHMRGARLAFQDDSFDSVIMAEVLEHISGARLAFQDDSFDSVIMAEVLEYMRSSQKIIEEAMRVVRNGGRIIISVPDGSLLCSFFVKKSNSDISEGPLIDVIMPTYNGRKSIERAIKSILSQTYQNWNLIVVNDGGEDVKDVLDEFHDNRIKYIIAEHKGKAHALNVGIKNSNGEFISYLDDDDIFYPLHLEALISAALSERSDFVYDDWYEVSLDEDGRETHREFEFRQDVTSSMLILRNYINHKCILHRRSLLEKTGMYDEQLDILIDWDMIRRLSFASEPCHIWNVTSERLRYYKQGALENRITSLWTKDPDKAKKSVEKIIKKTIELPATEDQLKESISAAMLSFSYYHHFEINRKISEMQSQHNSQIITLEQIISQRDKETSELKSQLLEVTSQAQKLDSDIAEMQQIISQRDKETLKLKSQLLEVTSQAQKLDSDIAEIQQSIVWRMTMRFHNDFVEKALPKGSMQRKWYDLGLKGGRTLLNEGLNSLWLKYIDYKKGQNVLQDNYILWIQKNEPDELEFSRMEKEAKTFKNNPKISIITPVWNIEEKWLTKAIDSVQNQVYNNWELCITDGGSTKPHIKRILDNYAQKDKRIKVNFLEENRGISGNSNEALLLATGDFICFLDHDDELAPFALYEVVKLLNLNPEIDFIYSDEDKLDEAGKRCDAFFKPDWSPDLLLSVMYTCHLGIYRKKLVDSIGGFRNGVDGSQDYDFVLRFTEHTNPKRIVHIPKILYHWRKISGSIASDPNAKNLINIQAAKKALNDALVRRGIDGEVLDGKWISSYRVKRKIIGNPKVSIIIPTRDHVDLLRGCIDSLISKTTYSNYELIVIDNNSVEHETIEYLNKLDYLVISFPEKFNFSKIVNLGAKYAKGEYLLLLNNDIQIINPDWIDSMLEHAQRSDVGAVGCKLLYPGGTIQHAGVVLGLSPDPRNKVAGHIFIQQPDSSPGYFGLANVVRNVSAVTAAAMMIRKSIFEEVAGFDENLAVSYNDVDFCLKIRNSGYLIVYTPYAELLHHESISRGGNLDESEVRYMLEKWGSALKNDPYYNPNLSLRSVNCVVNLD
jgi:glycosyltransferase involved in cell wall biosynthesis/ubiquinone/menaquinone biosynthesis C-methylase UbiE